MLTKNHAMFSKWVYGDILGFPEMENTHARYLLYQQERADTKTSTDTRNYLVQTTQGQGKCFINYFKVFPLTAAEEEN